MLTKNVDANHGSSATTYANYLVSQIKVRSLLYLSSHYHPDVHGQTDRLVQVTDELLALVHLDDRTRLEAADGLYRDGRPQRNRVSGRHHHASRVPACLGP